MFPQRLTEQEIEQIEDFAEECEEEQEDNEELGADADRDPHNDRFGLTKAELEALEDDDDEEPETDVDPEPEPLAATESPSDDEPSPAGTTPEPDDEADADGAGEGDDTPEAGAADEDAPARAPRDDRSPVRYAEGTIQEADEALRGVTEERAALKAKYRDGELDAEEYEDARETLDERYLDARDARRAIQMSEANAAHQWQEDNALFFERHPDYATSPSLQGALQAQLGVLAQSPEWQGRRPSFAMIDAARTQVDLEFGRGKAQSAPAPAPKEPDKAGRREALAGRGKGRDALPQTLSGVPAAEAPGTGKDAFASLDALDGQAFETALAKLSSAQLDAYFADETQH